MESHFGMVAPESIERLYKRELGGGALLDIGVYALSFIQVLLPYQLRNAVAHRGNVIGISVGALSLSNVSREIPSQSCSAPVCARGCGWLQCPSNPAKPVLSCRICLGRYMLTDR